MPSLALFAHSSYPAGVKRALARRLGDTYAEMMETGLETITVAIPDMGADGVWRCGEEGPEPSALLMCDIRRGRTAERREHLARRLIADCENVAGVDSRRIKVEFTQHSGDEMYHPFLGGFNTEWKASEAGQD
jgi:phenylpyruvate tautomerase PptA (4-oxalocrotonate tautomerase family)